MRVPWVAAVTSAPAVEGVVAALRSDPSEAARERRAALLQDVVTARGQREALESQIAALDEKILFLRAQADALLDAPTLDAAAEDRWLRAALAKAVRVDAAIVAQRSAAKERQDADSRSRQPEPEVHEIAVLAAMEPAEGPPRSLALVLPVYGSVQSDWAAHADDLQAKLAWRVVGALAGVLRATGAEDAPLRFDRFEGCLSIQVWLGGTASGEALRGHLTQAFESVHAAAEELQHAGLELFVAWVEPQMISGRAP